MKTTHLFLAASAVAVSIAFSTAASAETFQAPPNAKVSAAMDGTNLIVKWEEPLKVSEVQHFVGHLVPAEAGRIVTIRPGAAKQATLANFRPEKDGFNMKLGERWLHLECGSNSRTSMPGFQGVAVDCSRQQGGILVGALVTEKNVKLPPPKTAAESRDAAARIATGEAPAPAAKK